MNTRSESARSDAPVPRTNTVRKRRMLFVLALFGVVAAATALVTLALQRNVAYLYTPNEILAGKAGEQVRSGETRFRLGGMVAAGSFRRDDGSMEARFKVTDGDAELPVSYTGILPDLFREKQAVVATGKMRDGVFVAEQVLAKHDETYVPKEVADKMGLAHKKHNVADAPVGATDTDAKTR
ncbi:MAG: cytochrome c maturation protein CcmE [Lysobacter sp.]|nr:cytochrome c maturation protein CcmE [Lysobacter sp.]